MPITITEKEIPELLEFIGLKDAKDLADFKDRFKTQWHTAESFFESEDFKKHIGKVNGSLVSKSKAIAKQFGIELTGTDIENKKTEEIFETILTKLQESNNGALEDLKKKAGQGKDEKYTQLETNFNNMKRDYDTLTETNKKLKEDWDADKQNFGNTIKNEKLSFRTKDLFANFKWAAEANELTKKGFMASISEKAKFDLDESDNLIVLDAKTGKKFDNPGKHAAFLSPDEFLMKEGVEAKVYKTNNDGGKPASSGWGSGFNTGENQNQNNNNSQNQPARRNDLAVTAYQ